MTSAFFKGFFALALFALAVLSSLGSSVGEARADDRTVRVAFFNPQNADDPFWLPVERFMRAAANDLNMEVTTHVAGHNRAKMVEQVREVVMGADKPDFIVFKNFRGNAPEILKIAELGGVKSFIFNAGLTAEERPEHGGPREHYRHWIGQMLPGDELAGYNLAISLIKRARDLNLTNGDGKIVMVGLTGTLSDTPAIERNKGLERALEESPDVVFQQLVPARWDRAQAAQKAEGLFRRYPDVAVMWAANDPMALGAVDAAERVGLSPGKDFITGGVDWNPPALEAIRAGTMHTSIGGHFMEGGWVMVMLYDYVHGRDFADDGGAARFSEMAGLTSLNLDKYLTKFLNENWDRVDFGKFSKVNNPALKSYDFSLDRILDQL